MKKKTVSLLLSLAMCLTMLPGQSVFAAETSTETETEAASEHWQPCRESDRWNHRRSERIQLPDPDRRFRTYELQWLYPG